eukprot:gene4608-9158_t
MLKDIGAEEEIRSSVEIFKQTLFKMVATSEGTLSIVTEARIQQACAKFETLTIEIWQRNCRKFEMYVSRNILIPKSIDGQEISILKENYQRLCDEVELLQRRSLYLTALHVRLSKECKDADCLMKTITTALFEIKVSMQAFESGNAPPLESNGLFNMVSNLDEQIQTLRRLHNHADNLLKEMSQYQINEDNSGMKNKSMSLCSLEYKSMTSNIITDNQINADVDILDIKYLNQCFDENPSF